MTRILTARAEHWPLHTPFRISRGVKTAADVVAVTLEQDGCRGRGEGCPYARYGETTASVLAQIAAAKPAIEAGAVRADLAALLSPGAARNALDCALWDLEARQTGRSVADLLGLPPLMPVVSAMTVSLDTADRMGSAAMALAGAALIKVKVDRQNPADCIAAVRAAAPDARLIVDPNESWTFETLRSLQPALRAQRVDLVEQPLPAGEDAALDGYESGVPLCADESVHVRGDLPGLAARYRYVNIKLDKAGGLTEALNLLGDARASGFGVMVGCMVSSSLSIAPAFHVARHAQFIDLDGATWLAADHAGGAVQRGAELFPPTGEVWGGPGVDRQPPGA